MTTKNEAAWEASGLSEFQYDNTNSSEQAQEELTINADGATLDLEAWAEPQVIKNDLLPVATFEEYLLPQSLIPWVKDVAHRMQCPIDFVAAGVMVMLSSVIGAGCSIRPKQKDDWSVIPNLWGAVVAKPGKLKTPALVEAIVKPLRYLEEAAKRQWEGEEKSYQAQMIAHESEVKAIEDQMRVSAKAEKKRRSQSETNINSTNSFEQPETVTLAQLVQEMQRLDAPMKPKRRRFMTNSATIEKQMEIAAESPRGYLKYADELMREFKTWERSGHEADRAFHLEGWTGGTSFTHDTIGRGTTDCPSNTISLFGGTQPDRLTRYYLRTIQETGDDGLFPRVQMLVCPDDVAWTLVDRVPDRDARERVYKIASVLAETDLATLDGAQMDENDVRPYFRFGDEAQQVFNEWITDLETNKFLADDMPVLLEHVAKYRSLMPSIALIIHLVEIAAGNASGPVSKEAALKAADWCEYLESHARRVYVFLNGDGKAVIRLAEKIRHGLVKDGFTSRDVYRSEWASLETPERVESACVVLEAAHWIRRQHIFPGRDGGRSTDCFLINPKVRVLPKVEDPDSNG